MGRTTHPTIGANRIARTIRAELQAADTDYWRDVARAVRRHGEPQAAEVVPYPALDLEDIAQDGVAIAWTDAQANVQNALGQMSDDELWGGLRKATAHGGGPDAAHAAPPKGRPNGNGVWRIGVYASRDVVGEAKRLVRLAEDMVIPTDAIRQYVSSRIPPLRNVLDLSRRRICRDIIARIAGEGLGVRQAAARLQDQGFGLSHAQRENISRTEATTLYQHGSVSRYRASAVVAGMKFSAIRDGRETDVCAALDGRVFAADDTDGVTPPLHFSCRSVLVPVMHHEAPERLDMASEFLVDDSTANPLAGFGDLDTAGMPAPQEPVDLYRVLDASEKQELRDFLDEVRG